MDLINKPDLRNASVSDRRRRALKVAVDQRVAKADRRQIRGPVPPEFQSPQAAIVMLALLQGLADNVLGGDAWAESIQSAYAIAVDDYGVDPELFLRLVDNIMEVKDKRFKDVN